MTTRARAAEGVLAGRRSPAGAAGARPAGPAGTRPRTPVPQPATGRDRLESMARGFVSLFLEVEAGRRPRAQLAGLITPMLYARLTPVWVRGGVPGSVEAVRITGRGPATVDVVTVVRRGPRCGAVALRLVRCPGGWLVDEVAVPEHGPLPLPAYPVPTSEAEADDAVEIPTVVTRDRVPAGVR